MSKEISGRGRTRSRGVKGNQGVGDFRCINILQFFLFIIIIIFYHFFPYFFTHTHTHYPHPRPTTSTHYPRHLATLYVGKGEPSPTGRRRRGSRDEKGNQGVEDLSFINILLFSIYIFFSITFINLSFFLYTFFCPRHLPTHTHDPHPRPTPTTRDLNPLPTTHDI